MDIIAGQKAKGATVVMVTHQMEEVERLCDRVILLKNGTSEAYGTIDEVQNEFYGLIILLAGQMLGSTLEEKENRVTEMILTTLKPTTLISGKVIALFAIGLLQVAIFTAPIVIGYLFFREQINIPDFDLSALVFEPVPMIIGFLILLGGFALFTTTLVAIGAVMPTAKEAGNFMGVMIALIFVPFYAVSLIFSNPQALIVQVFTYFPFSAPVTAMIRNGLGSLSLLEAAILYIGAVLMFSLAVRLFQYGSISYTSKVNNKTALSNGRRDPGRKPDTLTPAAPSRPAIACPA
ncbi:ABC-type Na+ efflux pump permease subunit [Arthrobacter sp. UYCo732]